jgi:hypothetical protein
MKRCVLPAILLVVLAAGPAGANGFGLFRRSAEVRYGYYYPSYYYPSYYYYPSAPVYYYPSVAAPVVPYHAPVVQPAVVTPVQYAVPTAAPPSLTPEPVQTGEPPLFRPSSGRSTAMRVGESFYEVLPGPAGMSKTGEGERCSVAFWNLTGQTLTLRVSGRDVSLAPSRSVTLDVTPTFAWQVVGREGEATTIPSGRATAEILIRR